MIKKILALLIGFILSIFLFEMLASAEGSYVLTVDGKTYAPSKIVGRPDNPTVHFNTPETNPSSAAVSGDRIQSWTGNGSENLPCEGGIHWISNANVLTVSNCLGGETNTTTTATTIPETTIVETTVPETTVVETTIPETTVVETTIPETTVLEKVTTTTMVEIIIAGDENKFFSTTTISQPVNELPSTGSENWIAAAIATVLLLGGSTLIYASRRS